MNRIKIKYFIIALILFSGFVWYVNYSLHFNGFMWNDSQDYNQMARNVYEGKGFSTSVLRPMSFLSFKYLPHPEYTRPPLYAYLLALFYGIFGVNDLAVVLVDGLFYILFVVMTFLFSLEFSRSRLTALAVTATTALSGWFLSMSIVGSTDIVFAALFMIFLYILFRHHDKPFLIGLCTGLLYRTRLNGFFVAGALVIAEYNPLVNRKNWKRFVIFCMGVLLMASPVLVRNMLLQGPAQSAMTSASFFAGGRSMPGYYYYSQLKTVSGWEFIKSHPAEICELLINKCFMLVGGMPRDFGVVFLLLMAAGLYVGLGEESQTRIKRIVAWTFVVQTFFLVLTNPEARYYGFLVPPLVLFFFVSLKPLMGRRVEAATCAVVLLLVILSSITFWKEGRPFNHYRILGEEVKAQTDKNDVIISDLAWAMSWYGERKAVWLTYDLDTMDTIAKSIPIKYALISVETVIHPLAPYKDRMWQRLLLEPDSYSIPGFKKVKTLFLHGQPIAILYKVERYNRN